MPSPLFIIVAVLAVFAVGLSKSNFAPALGAVAVPLLSLVMPTREAAGMMLPILCLMDAIAIYRDENGEAEPFADGFLAPAVFEALKADMLSGLAQELSLEATTNLWIREEDRDRPAGQPADWYLGLAEDGRGSAPARGFIESLEWRPAAAMVAAEPRDIEHSSPAVSDTAQPEEHDEETSADQLRRINWSLKQLLLVLAFLLLIIAVK